MKNSDKINFLITGSPCKPLSLFTRYVCCPNGMADMVNINQNSHHHYQEIGLVLLQSNTQAEKLTAIHFPSVRRTPQSLISNNNPTKHSIYEGSRNVASIIHLLCLYLCRLPAQGVLHSMTAPAYFKIPSLCLVLFPNL